MKFCSNKLNCGLGARAACDLRVVIKKNFLVLGKVGLFAVVGRSELCIEDLFGFVATDLTYCCLNSGPSDS